MAQSEISKPIHVILDGDNYSLWAQGMSSFLKGCKLWLYVTGQRYPPKQQKELKIPLLFDSKIGMVSIIRSSLGSVTPPLLLLVWNLGVMTQLRMCGTCLLLDMLD
jgi:hypothetical protein